MFASSDTLKKSWSGKISSIPLQILSAPRAYQSLPRFSKVHRDAGTIKPEARRDRRAIRG
jgi:hypothetical protein